MENPMLINSSFVFNPPKIKTVTANVLLFVPLCDLVNLNSHVKAKSHLSFQSHVPYGRQKKPNMT